MNMFHLGISSGFILTISGAAPERICKFSKFQKEKISVTMVGRRIKFLILDELKQS